jgi:hypothetical protein
MHHKMYVSLPQRMDRKLAFSNLQTTFRKKLQILWSDKQFQ